MAETNLLTSGQVANHRAAAMALLNSGDVASFEAHALRTWWRFFKALEAEQAETARLRAENDRLAAELKQLTDDPMKGFRDLFSRSHDVHEYYREDPCEHGHTFMWSPGDTTDGIPFSSVRCQKCGKTYGELQQEE